MLLAFSDTRIILLNLADAGIYWLLAESSMLFAGHHGSVVLWWPSGGFALAVLLLNGLRFAPGVFIGAFISGISFGGTLEVASIIGLGNCSEIVFGWWLLSQRMKLDVSINRLHDFLLILSVSPLIATIGSLVGAASLTTVESGGRRR